MTKEQALAFCDKNNINLLDKKSVIVTSDNAVYFDSELAPIKAHCEAHGKTYFVVKGEDEKMKEVVLENETPKKKKK